jgi:hypothetical protein
MNSPSAAAASITPAEVLLLLVGALSLVVGVYAGQRTKHPCHRPTAIRRTTTYEIIENMTTGHVKSASFSQEAYLRKELIDAAKNMSCWNQERFQSAYRAYERWYRRRHGNARTALILPSIGSLRKPLPQ